MKYFLMIFLVASLLAGCSAASTLENATQAAAPAGNRQSAGTTEVATLEATMQDSTSAHQPLAITAGPPKIPIAPIQGTSSTSNPPEGWKTFTSPTLGVALDYPASWSVTENGQSVEFSLPQGQPILLQSGQSNAASGQDCTTLINSYGQAGDICFDAASSTYRAIIKKSADGSTPALILSTISQEKPTVFLQMFNSFRFTP